MPTGNWTVRIQTPSRQVLASVKFLIVPLEFHDGIRVDSLNSTQTKLEELQLTIDSLIGNYYELQDLCYVKPVSQVLLATLNGNAQHDEDDTPQESQGHFEAEACTETAWSSLYPDPKGVIESMDPVTGSLLP